MPYGVIHSLLMDVDVLHDTLHERVEQCNITLGVVVARISD